MLGPFATISAHHGLGYNTIHLEFLSYPQNIRLEHRLLSSKIIFMLSSKHDVKRRLRSEVVNICQHNVDGTLLLPVAY